MAPRFGLVEERLRCKNNLWQRTGAEPAVKRKEAIMLIIRRGSRVDSDYNSTSQLNSALDSQLRAGRAPNRRMTKASGGRGDPFRVAPAVEAKEAHGEQKSQSRYTRYPHEQRREQKPHPPASTNNMSEGRSGAASGGQLEERVDLSAESDAKISQAEALIGASHDNLREALALLAALEKRCRVGNDTPSLVRVCETSLQLCRDCGDDEALVATLKNLSTRRSQKTKAVSALVQKAMPWVMDGDGFSPLAVANDEQKAIRETLVGALRDITDGKIFLEAERARLTRALATIKEEDGDIAAAADVLQDVHVETFGSLSKREKVEFILEQMRLTLGKKDYVRAAIVAGKINKKAINEEGMEDHKVKYFTLMTEYHRHEKDAFELAKDYHNIYSTSTVQADEAQWREALQSTVIYLALSKYSNEQQDMLNRVNLDTNLEKIESCKNTVKLLLTKEIINYPLQHQTELEAMSAFSIGGPDLEAYWKKTFHTRIVQHNVRIAALYYRRIHGKRLAQLLGLEPAALEAEISSMVSDGSVYAKIDRPNDIIRFAAQKSPEAILSDWASDISSLLHLVESTTHLIHKENMIAGQ